MAKFKAWKIHGCKHCWPLLALRVDAYCGEFSYVVKRKKRITFVQPDEANEMVDEDADIIVQSGHQIRRGIFLQPKAGH